MAIKPIMGLLLLLLFICSSPTAMASYNVLDFGAKADGRTDDTQAFLATWAATCGSKKPASMYVPRGKYLISQASFRGPCNNKATQVFIDGTLIAPASYTSKDTIWITFKYVKGLSIIGGTLDGRGRAIWACKKAGKSCPPGTTSLTIGQSKNVLIRGMKLMNSEVFHMAIFASSGVTVQDSKFIAPGDSPNTDGIHVQMSTGVTITGSSFRTGDDCISMGAGSSDVWIEHINCGPGHGISIGSLNGGTHAEHGVRNITVKNVVFTGTQNGLRIKTWAKPHHGFVKGVKFEHAVMKNVKNPMVIDQNYCPSRINCPRGSSGVKISDILFTDVKGTSVTPVGVKFDCSRSNPCKRIKLKDIRLTYGNKPAQSYCKYAQGTAFGIVIPKSCL